jgi:hypothetical protein
MATEGTERGMNDDPKEGRRRTKSRSPSGMTNKKGKNKGKYEG